MSHEYFRVGVGLIVSNARGEVLAIERSDRPGALQLPQGGVEVGESAIDAAYRELREETGLLRRHVTLVAEFPAWLGYELPERRRSRKTGRGQVHRWFSFRMKASDAAIRLEEGGEARSFRWMAWKDLVATTVSFRRGVYQLLADHAALHLGR